MLSNVVIREDVNGNRRPDKAKSSEKIDGIVAAIMALGQSMSDNISSRHIYERRGILGFDDENEAGNNNTENYDTFGFGTDYTDYEY
jgi:phage terminase large subunit-like protein